MSKNNVESIRARLKNIADRECKPSKRKIGNPDFSTNPTSEYAEGNVH